jgi:DNA-binding IclR family transcriptional regulator
MEEPELEAYLHRTKPAAITHHTLVAREDILKDLEMIRQHGYAVDDQEMEEGVRCIAALIYDHRGNPAASVSITGTATRITPDRIRQYGGLVNACAQAISGQLGYKPANSK